MEPKVKQCKQILRNKGYTRAMSRLDPGPAWFFLIFSYTPFGYRWHDVEYLARDPLG